MNPFISIIVPVYNIERFIRACIESLENQTYGNFEIILIDDGSKDGSGEICDRAKDEFDNITVIHKTNSGASSARNTGIEAAKGDYIVFVDGDDTVSPVMLERLVKAKNNYPDLLPVCGIHKGKSATAEKCFKDREDLFVVPNKDFFIIQTAQMFNNPVNKLYDRKIICENNIRFNPEIRIGEDMIFNADYVLKSDCDFIVVNEPLYFYDTNVPQSTSKRYIPDVFDDYIAMDRKFRQLIAFTETDMSKYEKRYATILLFGVVHSIQNTISEKNKCGHFEKIKTIKRILNTFDIRQITSKANTERYSGFYIRLLRTKCAALIYIFRMIKK